MSSESLHEPAEKLSPATIDRHRATVSLMEELEAIDWYDQRIDAATDEDLEGRSSVTIATKRKSTPPWCWNGCGGRIPALDQQLRTYLFKDGDIMAAEAEAEGAGRRGCGRRLQRREPRHRRSARQEEVAP